MAKAHLSSVTRVSVLPFNLVVCVVHQKYNSKSWADVIELRNS